MRLFPPLGIVICRPGLTFALVAAGVAAMSSGLVLSPPCQAGMSPGVNGPIRSAANSEKEGSRAAEGLDRQTDQAPSSGRFFFSP